MAKEQTLMPATGEMPVFRVPVVVELTEDQLRQAGAALNVLHTGKEAVPLDVEVSPELKKAAYNIYRIRHVVLLVTFDRDGRMQVAREEEKRQPAEIAQLKAALEVAEQRAATAEARLAAERYGLAAEWNDPATYQGQSGFWVQSDCCFFPARYPGDAIEQYRKGVTEARIGISHNFGCGSIWGEGHRAARYAAEALKEQAIAGMQALVSRVQSPDALTVVAFPDPETKQYVAWAIEPDQMTCGRDREHALEMMADALRTLARAEAKERAEPTPEP